VPRGIITLDACWRAGPHLSATAATPTKRHALTDAKGGRWFCS
jgi:hypothetical protein